MKQALALAALVCGWASVGCGRQELELLVQVRQDDPCLGFISQSDCAANAALGCSYQPNAIGCRSDDPSCQPGMCQSGDPFVRRAARSFLLSGQPFRFAGVSSWALLQPGNCTGVKPAARAAWIHGAYDDLVPSRAKVARFFAFQSSAGASGDDFTWFDASGAPRRATMRGTAVATRVRTAATRSRTATSRQR